MRTKPMTYIRPVAKAKPKPILRRRGIFSAAIIGIGMMNIATSIAREIEPRAIVAFSRAGTHFNKKGGSGVCRFGLQVMAAYKNVTMPPIMPKTMRNCVVLRSHVFTPNVLISKKSKGSFALKIAQLPAEIPFAISYSFVSQYTPLCTRIFRVSCSSAINCLLPVLILQLLFLKFLRPGLPKFM